MDIWNAMPKELRGAVGILVGGALLLWLLAITLLLLTR